MNWLRLHQQRNETYVSHLDIHLFVPTAVQQLNIVCMQSLSLSKLSSISDDGLLCEGGTDLMLSVTVWAVIECAGTGQSR